MLVFAGSLNDLLGYFTVINLLRNAMVFIAWFKLHKQPGHKPGFKMPGGAVMALLAVVPTCILPVSYTHLDVYKRQAFAERAGRHLL